MRRACVGARGFGVAATALVTAMDASATLASDKRDRLRVFFAGGRSAFADDDDVPDDAADPAALERFVCIDYHAANLSAPAFFHCRQNLRWIS